MLLFKYDGYFMFVLFFVFLCILFVIVVLFFNMIIYVVLLFVFIFVKLLLLLYGVCVVLFCMLVVIVESWIVVNSVLFDVFICMQWYIEGLEGLKCDGNYFVLCNYQSWVDILVLQKVFNCCILFLCFFFKSQLIWVLLLGLVWWVLDFFFMKCYLCE